MPAPIIELTHVAKSFGQHPVLDNLNLTVLPGQTYAFLGRNGAGKTTTIRLLMGLLKPQSGLIRVLGLDPAKDALEIRRRVGYLAEDQQMWGWMKVREILRFMSAFYPTWDSSYARDLADRFRLAADQKIRHLSKGENVRLGLLLALAHRPRLMILDDPALGLDPIMRKEFLRDIVEHLQGQDVTVFFSSHLLYEVEPVADVVGILDHGRMVTQSPTEDLRTNVRQFRIDAAEWPALRNKIPGLLDVRPDGNRLALTVDNAPAVRPLLGPALLNETELNLDEIFEAYVAGQKPNASSSPPLVAVS